ncbi:MAG TPA: MarR family transcriptional regulator [Gaiellaceae bacterium]|nr:MarR family transcriptional regulator [Gaiellaceae bacterium]
MTRQELKPLAAELATCWRELGTILASRRLHASLHPELGAKLTPSKVRALALIGESGGLRIGELAERVGVDDTTATRMVDRLEELGVAERRGAEGDRRATLVDLTDEGRGLMRGVAEQRLLFYCDVLDALDPEEREQLVNLTAKAALVLRARSEALVGR